jgi:hypothetical protein
MLLAAASMLLFFSLGVTVFLDDGNLLPSPSLMSPWE